MKFNSLNDEINKPNATIMTNIENIVLIILAER